MSLNVTPESHEAPRRHKSTKGSAGKKGPTELPQPVGTSELPGQLRTATPGRSVSRGPEPKAAAGLPSVILGRAVACLPLNVSCGNCPSRTYVCPALLVQGPDPSLLRADDAGGRPGHSHFMISSYKTSSWLVGHTSRGSARGLDCSGSGRTKRLRSLCT